MKATVMQSARIVTSASLLIVLTAGPSVAMPLFPVSYDMLNGNTGSYNYWDESYTGTGDKTLDASVLSGGLGDLTDGTIATKNWNIVEAPPGNGPYVGWTINPTITFHFSGPVTIHSIVLSVDDANGIGGVRPPASVDYGLSGGSLSTSLVPDPTSGEPFDHTISGLNLTGQDFVITLNRQGSTTLDWVFLSEVQFFGTTQTVPDQTVPEPSSMVLVGAGLSGLGILHRLRRRASCKSA